MIRTIIFSICFVFLLGDSQAAELESGRSLFNGKNFEGWETYLGPPHASLNLGKEPIGVNRDPTGVYSVVQEDGQPAIRISGQIWGAITTLEEFENYHLRFETKWGQKKWPPRENTVRDSGLLYHCVGPHGAGSKFWMKSFECQVQENDVGDFWSVAGVLVDVEGDRPGDKGPLTFRKGGTLHAGWKNRIIRNPRSEKPSGEWYTVEVYLYGQTAVHVCDGKTNMILNHLRHVVEGKETPLTKGKIQLQSESAEVYYRNIMLRPIDRIPDEVLLK